jgi:hypothetical protein
MRKCLILLATAAVFCFSNIGCTRKLSVNVEAESPAQAELVTKIVRDAYPLLDADQQQLVRDGLVFRAAKQIDNAFGYGPEDDPEYRYPDKTLYPKGTIKVNITPSFLSFAQGLYDKDTPINSIFGGLLVELVAHEIKHVQQYMAEPVLALSSAEECPKGICDDAKLEATAKKLNYEFEATIYGQRKYAEATNTSVEKDLVIINEYAYRAYAVMYEPPMLVKKCVAHSLTEEERVLAKRYIERDVLKKYAGAYPYLTVVMERLTECMEK